MVQRSSALLALFLCSSAVWGQQSSPQYSQQRRAQDLIGFLAAHSFADRQRARQELYELGRPAIEPLEAAANSDDPEIRLQAMELLIAMRGRGFLGISLIEVPLDEALEPEAETPETVVVAREILNFRAPLNDFSQFGVTKPFPAEGAGMEANDRILAVNERPVHTIKDLMREVIEVGPGRVAILIVQRNDKTLRLAVRLTRDPVKRQINAWGGIEQTRDPAPPVDLEKELETPAAVRPSAMQTPVPRAQRPMTSQTIIVKKMMIRNGETEVIGGIKVEPAPPPSR